MFLAAHALRTLEVWLPGEPMRPRLAPFPARQRRVRGALFFAGALGVVVLVAFRLWPDYHQWHGTPAPWILAMTFALTGAWLVGAVGKGSARAAAGLWLWMDSLRNRWLEALAFLLILALAIFLRTYRLNSVPPGIYVDETNAGLEALYILEGRDVSPFSTGWYGTPNAYIYYMAAVFNLLGANWLSLKAVSLIPAILTVPAVYLLGRLMFGPLVGLSSMLLIAVSRWHMSMSRWGWNETAPPLFQVLATFFLIRGLRDRRAMDYGLSGLIAGLSIYTYLSARLAIATLILYVLFWLISDPAGLRASLRRSWLGLMLVVLVGLVTVSPIAVTFIRDPFAFGNRVSEISILRDMRDQGSADPLLLNLGDILKFFHQTGDHQGKHNLPDEPMADPFTGLLLAVGLAHALMAWRDQRRMLLLLWLVLGLSGSFLSSHHESPQSYRSLTALPAVVLLAADVLDQVTRALSRVSRESRIFPGNQFTPLTLSGGFLCVALAGAGIWEATVYFGRQAESVAVQRGFNPTENGIARETIVAIRSNTAVYLSPSFSEYSPMRFLLYGVIKAAGGRNTLDDRPYRVVLPDTTLPLRDDGRDVLMLLDRDFWPLRDYITSFYPGAQAELLKTPDGDPIYLRINVARSEVAALQGLTQRISYLDGRTEERLVPNVSLGMELATASGIVWEGSLGVEHGGVYGLAGGEALQVFVDGRLWEKDGYLGRGLYGLRVAWNGAPAQDARLLWRLGEGGFEPVPAELLFRVPGHQQGLLAEYWSNTEWEGEPLFRQLTPFLFLAWPDEEPVVPRTAFSARYAGFLRVEEAGTYMFRVQADDGARLMLDGRLLGEGLVAGQPNKFEVSLDLAAGDHPLQLDYVQQGGGNGLRFFWSVDNGPFTPVPPRNLVPSGG
jgi:hypothetical protein